MSEVCIVGTRGVPNRYGGFERLAEVLAPYLVSRGHSVTVFCDPALSGASCEDDTWRGVKRRYVSSHGPGGIATLTYDFQSFMKVGRDAVALVFGYGTGLFHSVLASRRIPHCVNMDGLEWRRSKWSPAVKGWLRLNEKIAARWADELIADHPEIQAYVKKEYGRDANMIAYGVDLPAPGRHVPEHSVLKLVGDAPFFLVIARPEPENQVHVILAAFAASKRRARMVVVGNFGATVYGRSIKARYPEVDFVGPIYDTNVVDALRARSDVYIHGHSVGGTNPSLIEAMAAGAFVVAHDNVFNRWVAGSGSRYFRDESELRALLDDPVSARDRVGLVGEAQRVCSERFRWSNILQQYEAVVNRLSLRVSR